jgi:hypothetical protein
MKRSTRGLAIGIILTVLGILGIFSPAIFEYVQQWQSQPQPSSCQPNPCLQVPPPDIGNGAFWILGIILFATGMIIIARSREEITVTRIETGHKFTRV